MEIGSQIPETKQLKTCHIRAHFFLLHMVVHRRTVPRTNREFITDYHVTTVHRRVEVL